MNSLVTYDFHTHILPTIDDGARSIEKSIDIIDNLVKLGIKNICLTPHYYTNEESFDDFLKRRNDAYDLLKPSLEKYTDCKFVLGTEVFITDYLFTQEYDKRICYENTSYMLCEFSYDADFEGRFQQYLYKLMSNDIKPIIAHVERYPKLLKNASKRRELLNNGILFQSNYTSLTDRKYKKKVLKLIADGEVTLLGSDAHSLRRNPPEDLVEAQELIIKKIGKEALEKIEKNSKKVLFEG